METPAVKIGLTMMVKNEAKIITRALNSALSLVNFALIVDTGSSDETISLVNQWLSKHNLEGKVIEEPWQDFGYNRSYCLKSLREIDNVDYALMLDADETLELEDGFDTLKWELKADAYSIPIHRGTLVYPLPRLTKNSMSFFYAGPAHEWLECEAKKYSKADLKGVRIKAHWDGARISDPDRYRREAEGFKEALLTELDPFRRQRYSFYLAQSYRDSQDPEAALDAYLNRAGMNGWAEEVYVSLLNAARLKEKLGHSFLDILDTYRRAISLNNRRAEAIHGAAKFCRLSKFYGEGYGLAKAGIALPFYSNGLFVEKWIYDYGLLDEFSICAFYAGHYIQSWLAAERILLLEWLDEATRQRIEANAAMARAKV